MTAAFSNGTLHFIGSGFDPIQKLRQSGGDILLFYLNANGVLFQKKTLDPWYQATRIQENITSFDSNHSSISSSRSVYRQDNPGSPLACTQKMQWCALTASHDSRCTPLGTYYDVYTSGRATLTNSLTSDQVDWILGWLWLSPADVVESMGSESLLARRTLRGGIQGALPENQWQLDVEHWYHIVLAGYQKIYADVAAGPPSSYPEEWVRRPASEGQINMCQNQVSKSHPGRIDDYFDQHRRLESHQHFTCILQRIRPFVHSCSGTLYHRDSRHDRTHRPVRADPRQTQSILPTRMEHERNISASTPSPRRARHWRMGCCRRGDSNHSKPHRPCSTRYFGSEASPTGSRIFEAKT